MVATLVRTTSEQRRRFVQISAHELRTPITSIKGIVTLMREKATAGQAIPERLFTLMGQEADRLAGLITEVTEVFALQSGNLGSVKVPVNLTEVAAAVDAQHRYFLAPSAPDRLQVMGDPRRLTEVFRNLLDNAAKYSPPQTNISVEMEDRGGRVRAIVSDRAPLKPRAEVRRLTPSA